jgi:hypothetical protein
MINGFLLIDKEKGINSFKLGFGFAEGFGSEESWVCGNFGSAWPVG